MTIQILPQIEEKTFTKQEYCNYLVYWARKTNHKGNFGLDGHHCALGWIFRGHGWDGKSHDENFRKLHQRLRGILNSNFRVQITRTNDHSERNNVADAVEKVVREHFQSN
ncbi:MAG: hypothetical protein AABY07_00205 [Nanoarchaeota archaeon]